MSHAHEGARTSGRQDGHAPIEQMARDRLLRHSRFRGCVDGLTITARSDVLEISGVVPTFYIKQLLQDALKSIRGVRRVENRVQVRSTATRRDPAAVVTQYTDASGSIDP